MNRNVSRILGIVVALVIVAVIGWQLLQSFLTQRQFDEGRARGEAALEAGDFVEAESQLEQSLEAARGLGEQDPRYDESLLKLGEVREAQGKFNDTEYLYLEALRTRVARFGAVSQPVADMQTRLGNAYLLQDEWLNAEGLYSQAIDTWDQLGSSETMAAASAHLGLGRAMAAQGKLDKAEISLRRAAGILEKSEEGDKRQLALAYKVLGEVLDQRGMTADAAKIREQAQALRAATGLDGMPNLELPSLDQTATAAPAEPAQAPTPLAPTPSANTPAM
ncbi:MAG TPA: tetratricopeptide repeat protein [Terriglobales bacterium]|nr:tetratricopeptide repeat protein [Terriglobales bacterium]